MAAYTEYLDALSRPFRKLARLEFLQPDGTVAFALGNDAKAGGARDTRVFIQSGSVSVSLNNGRRRTASVTLANADDAFSFAVNKIWFGRAVRLSMGMILPDGNPFLLPQGVFYLLNPDAKISPSDRTVTYSLSDKWAALDGTLYGTLDATYQIQPGMNIFGVIRSILRLSRFDYEPTDDPVKQFDPVYPVFTTFYDGISYPASQTDSQFSGTYYATDTPYLIAEGGGSTFAKILLDLNDCLAGLIGYDATGALRLDPSSQDVDDADKPVLYTFDMRNPQLCSISESSPVSEVYNDVIVAGQGASNREIWGRAVNDDPRSDTNRSLVGRRLYYTTGTGYFSSEQCAALAEWELKRRSALNKSVTLTAQQMFHLQENNLISVRRTDKPGSPVERHLIQSFSVPIAETGTMSIQAASVVDIPEFTVTKYPG